MEGMMNNLAEKDRQEILDRLTVLRDNLDELLKTGVGTNATTLDDWVPSVGFIYEDRVLFVDGSEITLTTPIKIQEIK